MRWSNQELLQYWDGKALARKCSVQKMLMAAMAENGQWDSIDKAVAAFRARGEPCFSASTMTMLINLASRAKRLDTCALTSVFGCLGLVG